MRREFPEGWDTILPYIRPLAPLVYDPDVSEIMVNADGQVFVKRYGCIHPQSGRFPPDHLEAAVTRIARNLGQDISPARPLLQARLPDGSRVAAAMPPCSVGGISLTIRKFQHARFSLAALESAGMMTPAQREILVDAIAARHNILISGGAGTGKTTLLNALCGLIDPRQRVVVIEDVTELQVDQPNVVRFETLREMPGVPAVTIKDLLRLALRYRPDRIILGEVRGAEAYHLIQALNTGHAGNISTLHANSAEDTPQRLIGCVLQEVPSMNPDYILQHWIEPVIDLYVHISRSAEGKRTVEQIRYSPRKENHARLTN
jgi:pilus assembly protein CpaF